MGRTIELVLVLLALAGCAGPANPVPAPPSEDEARAYLEQVVALVLAGRLDDLCRVGSATCDQTLRRSTPAAAPSEPPTVVDIRLMPNARRADGTWVTGGRIIEVCGVDGLGHTYRSEILVYREGGRVIGKEPVFWTGLRIARGPLARAPDPGRPPCPAQA
jgi:hypothetical protein